MSATVLEINKFFRFSTKSDINKLLENMILTERQKRIFEMFYITKQGRGFTADTLFISESEVSKELRLIRSKMLKVGKNLGYFR